MACNVTFNRETQTIEVGVGDAVCEVALQECIDPTHVLDFIFYLAEREECAVLIPAFLVCLDEACQEAFGNNARGVFYLGSDKRTIDWKARTSTRKNDA